MPVRLLRHICIFYINWANAQSRISNSIWGSEEHEQIQQWLNNSRGKGTAAMYQQLPNCRVEEDQPVPLPTRLLDLGHDQEPSNHTPIRLITTDTRCRDYYLTLSHRWGTEHQLKLTKATISAFNEGIVYKNLPRTYRDAVKVARSLKFRYLWIDAMCIVQDDEEDWLREASEMANVYYNASCTIMVHSANNDDDGFLGINVARGSARVFRNPDVSALIAASSLSTRGWVFQERILSRRLIHFTSGDTFLEDASGIVTSRGEAPKKYDPLKDNKINIQDAWCNLSDWHRLIERYTPCRLTFETDRIPAILGLSRYYQEHNDTGAFLWGLWSKSIHQGLLWMIPDIDRRKTVQYYPKLRGSPPSWTWAQWEGPIIYPVGISRFKASCELHKTGPEYSSYLVFSAKAVGLTNVKAIYQQAPFLHMGFSDCHQIDCEERVWIRLDGEVKQDIVFSKATLAFVAYDYDYLDYHQEVESVLAFYFLLLCPTECNDRVEFRRVGMGALIPSSDPPKEGIHNTLNGEERRTIHLH